MYADKMTHSMERTIEETNRRREKQLRYNMEHGITPKAIIKSVDAIMGQTAVANAKYAEGAYVENTEKCLAADPVVQYMSAEAIRKAIDKNKKDMQAAVKVLDFIEAARLRDENAELEKLLEGKV